MQEIEILHELKKLTPLEQLTIIEAALQQLRGELKQPTPSPTIDFRTKLMLTAAEVLLPDYAADSEVTVFTSLDTEDFHA